jgi:predicted membrane channel-forming protein YqfA (hemolysin III family)|tara:strand:+ start:942 stop:1160 length:219 start_codon:yes stop_codon:yes gene_type:complete
MSKLEFIARSLSMMMGIASLMIVFTMVDAMDSTVMQGLFTVDRLRDTVCAVMGMVFFVSGGFFFLVAIPKSN